jgi:uncharacterized protein YjgD (DUF1641 family)
MQPEEIIQTAVAPEWADVATNVAQEWEMDVESIIEQIVELMSMLSTENQIELLWLLNAQFNAASNESKYSKEWSDARAAEMSNVF